MPIYFRCYMLLYFRNQDTISHSPFQQHFVRWNHRFHYLEQELIFGHFLYYLVWYLVRSWLRRISFPLYDFLQMPFLQIALFEGNSCRLYMLPKGTHLSPPHLYMHSASQRYSSLATPHLYMHSAFQMKLLVQPSFWVTGSPLLFQKDLCKTASWYSFFSISFSRSFPLSSETFVLLFPHLKWHWFHLSQTLTLIV